VGSNSLAVYTTVYPGVEKYLAAWSRSVCRQTDCNFDLWIGIDSLSLDQVSAVMEADLRPNWLVTSDGQSPTQIRINAIKQLGNCYSSVVFVDSDDLLHPSRVKAARASLEHFDVVACALRIIDESGHDLGITFGAEKREDLDSLLPRYNVFGLSNTAYRAEVLRRCLPISDASELLDWQLATRAWMRGAALGFDPTPRMLYRQYSSNLARVLPPFNTQHVSVATLKVLGHYRCLFEVIDDLPLKHRDALLAARERAQSFHLSISRSAETLDRYVQALNRITPEYVWWWCVAHPELENIWKN
jgi:hypothetical protein